MMCAACCYGECPPSMRNNHRLWRQAGKAVCMGYDSIIRKTLLGSAWAVLQRTRVHTHFSPAPHKEV